jgi:hypothetical protein
MASVTLRRAVERLERDATPPPAPPPLPADAVALAAAAGFPHLDAWQVAVLRGDWERLLLNCCRQSGKSTTTALLALDTALRTPRGLVLLLSPGERQSAELLVKVRDAYHALGAEGHVEAAEGEGMLHLTLPNGARVLALPGGERGVRGFSAPRLVVLDEAARIDDALYHAISPMVAVSGGRVVLLSTPYGRRGIFHRLWTEGGPEWRRVELRADACPRISPAFLEEERRTLPAHIFRQEYEASFEATDDQVFAFADVQAALSPDVAPLFADLAPAEGRCVA